VGEESAMGRPDKPLLLRAHTKEIKVFVWLIIELSAVPTAFTALLFSPMGHREKPDTSELCEMYKTVKHKKNMHGIKLLLHSKTWSIKLKSETRFQDEHFSRTEWLPDRQDLAF